MNQVSGNAEELLTVIFDYTARIANENRLKHVLVLMADMGRDMVKADRCAVWLIDHEAGQLFTAIAHGVGEIRISAGTGIVGACIAKGEPLLIEDAYLDKRHSSDSDKKTGYRTKAVLCIPFRNNAGEVIGAYQAINKLGAEEVFTSQDLRHLSLAAAYTGKALEAVMLHEEMMETQKEIISVMGEIGETRSRETGHHVRRVAQYSYLLALGLGMEEKEADLLRSVSPMHDIGKVAIPDSILLKPGKLTEEEFQQMKNHTLIGHQLLRHSKREMLQAASIVALQHHEKWDGSGYPNGLKGEDIHLYGRITAVADVFDALGSSRSYKKAWELEDIIKLLADEKGKHFDPKVVDAFMDMLPRILEVRDAECD